MTELGMLWQSKTISPAHEHFISSLIKQKIYIQTEKYQKLPPTKEASVKQYSQFKRAIELLRQPKLCVLFHHKPRTR